MLLNINKILKNFRRGFATNSSSSHSFVYLKEDSPRAHEDYIGETEFGWNDFRLETIKEKLFYVLAGKMGNGGWRRTKDEEEKEFQEQYNYYRDNFPELNENEFREAYKTEVDGESAGLISTEEARDPKVVVFGGSDHDAHDYGGTRSRRESISRGEVDFTRTKMLWYDVPPRDEYPFHRGDKVKIVGSDYIWVVKEHVHKDQKTIVLSTSPYGRTERTSLVDDITIIEMADEEY